MLLESSPPIAIPPAPEVAGAPEPQRAAAPTEASALHRSLCLLYSLAAYAVFFVTFGTVALWVSGFVLPRTIDSGPAGARLPAFALDAAFLLTFAVQHTIMARPRFKRWLTRRIPAAAERSTFVLVTSVLFLVAMAFWQPLPGVIWSVEQPTLRIVLHGLGALGWLTVLGSSFVIDHFDLFGVRQAWLHFRGRPRPEPRFTQRGIYRFVRHPLMLGFLIAFWSAPTLTESRLVLAALATLYIAVGIRFEERDLVRSIGPAYARYRERVPAVLPRLLRSR